jgi:hypothetical protein
VLAVRRKIKKPTEERESPSFSRRRGRRAGRNPRELSTRKWVQKRIESAPQGRTAGLKRFTMKSSLCAKFPSNGSAGD